MARKRSITSTSSIGRKPEENDFCVVNQLPIRGQNDRRPDIIIYLNGFPIVLFELKNPYEEQPNTLGAFNQVQHYKAGISQLFDFNALVVVSDGGMVGHADDDTPHAVGSTLHGMWTANEGMVRALEDDRRPRRVGKLDRRDESTDRRTVSGGRLLAYIRDFIVFEIVNDKIKKKGAKYHQFLAYVAVQ